MIFFSLKKLNVNILDLLNIKQQNKIMQLNDKDFSANKNI